MLIFRFHVRGSAVKNMVLAILFHGNVYICMILNKYPNSLSSSHPSVSLPPPPESKPFAKETSVSYKLNNPTITTNYHVSKTEFLVWHCYNQGCKRLFILSSRSRLEEEPEGMRIARNFLWCMLGDSFQLVTIIKNDFFLVVTE